MKNNWLDKLIRGIKFRKRIGEKFTENSEIFGEIVIIDITTLKLYLVKEKYGLVAIAELPREPKELRFKILNCYDNLYYFN